jgi:hypothetical protein
MGKYKGNGFVTIPLVIGFTLILLSIGLSLASVSFNEVDSSSSISKLNKAFEYAKSGGEDALTRIARNQFYTNTSGYSIDFSGDSTPATCEDLTLGCSTVKTYNILDGSTPFSAVIISEGQAGAINRKLQVGATIDSTSGFIKLINWTEVSGLPAVSTTEPTPSSMVNNAATLRAWVNPNGSTTTNAYFKYYTADPIYCDVNSGTRAPSSGWATPSPVTSGSIPIAISYALANATLSHGSIYYYCAIADDGAGNTILGNIVIFRNP